MFQEIDQKKQLLDHKRPLPPYSLKSLREKLLLEWTYHSNAIEGNTLTLKETKVVLEGITIGGKTMQEHLEVINHRDAILCMVEVVANKELLTEWQINNLHQLVLKGIDYKYAGKYRDKQVYISGAKHVPPKPFLLREKMVELITWHQGIAQSLHPVERALCYMLYLWVSIHLLMAMDEYQEYCLI